MSGKRKHRGRRTLPQVALLLESSVEISRAMLRGIVQYVHQYGAWALQLNAGGAGDLRVPDLRVWHGNGIIARAPSESVAAAIAASRLPTVMINPLEAFLVPSHPLSKCCRIQCDSEDVGVMAANYYLENGFDHFAYVCMPQPFNWSDWRRDAFCAKIAEAGRTCAIYPTPSAAEPEEELKRLGRWLRRLPKPVAVFAANDVRGRQVLKACLDEGIAVPYELAVLGVDDDPFICETSLPPLSSVAVDAEGAGYRAAELLDRLMSGKLRHQEIVRFSPTGVVARASSLHLPVHDRLVIRALEFVRINAGLNIRASDVADNLGVSTRWMERRFSEALGHSVIDEIADARRKTVRRLVTETNLPFSVIARRCGFTSANHLGVIFREAFHQTMSEMRNGVMGEKPASTGSGWSRRGAVAVTSAD